MQYITKATEHVANKIRNSRIELLEKEIELNLQLIFPDEEFKVKINFEYSRDNSTASLLIGKEFDGGIVYEEPRAQNGGFVKQLTSLSVVYTIFNFLGGKVLYMDEALASGDPESLLCTEDLFIRLLEKGVQIVAVEHKEEMYTRIPRKMLYLNKDRVSGEVSVEREEVI